MLTSCMPLHRDGACITYMRSHSIAPVFLTCVSDERHSAAMAMAVAHGWQNNATLNGPTNLGSQISCVASSS
jgi:hypothetical protein